MRTAPNRLSAEREHRLSGAEIDRGRRFTFRLDGREVAAFAGDTLLSAALAAGLTGAGTHDDRTVALDERFAPSVLLRGTMHDDGKALAMARTPAAEGLDLVTILHARRQSLWHRAAAVRAMISAGRSRLRLNYDDDAFPADPWFDAPSSEERRVDMIVIGGGLAGLSAALAAGKRGDRVLVVERRQWLGGDARFFGATGEEESPEEVLQGLTTALASLDNVEVLTRAEAFSMFEGTVRVNQVVVETGIPASRTLTIAAPRIVLATGCIERLPIFAGNRLPGVVGSVAAFHRAERFGVWIGAKALLSTATSVAYRVATLAKDAGIGIERIADARLNPQSRFVEFGKAYGIPLARSVSPRRVAPSGRRQGLNVTLMHSLEGAADEVEQFAVDQFVVGGCWQPDLALWHMAGGDSRWNDGSARLEAAGTLDGVRLAGAVAGYRSNAAVTASGRAAVLQLYGRAAPQVDDPEIDSIYETPDASTPIAPPDAEAEDNAYLDGGSSLALRPVERAQRRLWLRRRPSQWGFAEQPRPLGVADVAAGVELGAIPPDDAAIVAQERCVIPGDIAEAGSGRAVRFQGGAAAQTPPAYLAGRFGARTTVWAVEATDGRDFDIGCLVHLNADGVDPLAAIGVVFAPAPAGRKGGLAVIGKWPVAEGDALSVKDISASVPVRLVDPLRPVEAPIVVTPVKIEPAAAAAPKPASAEPNTAEAALNMIAGGVRPTAPAATLATASPATSAEVTVAEMAAAEPADPAMAATKPPSAEPSVPAEPVTIPASTTEAAADLPPAAPAEASPDQPTLEPVSASSVEPSDAPVLHSPIETSARAPVEVDAGQGFGATPAAATPSETPNGPSVHEGTVPVNGVAHANGAMTAERPENSDQAATPEPAAPKTSSPASSA